MDGLSGQDPKNEEQDPKSQDQKPKPEEKRQFINEKVKRRHPFRRALLRALFVIILAVIFGVVAAVVFVVARPAAQQLIFPPPETTQAVVTIPQDETMETTLVPVRETETEAEPEEETEPIEDLVQEAVESYKFTVDDADVLIGALREVASQADASIVNVRAIHQDLDWFDNMFETEGSYAGAIIAQTDAEYIIMTVEDAVEDVDAIKVTFSNNEEADARMKQQDTISGIAIVSVDKSDLSEDLTEVTEPLVLGNSNLVKEGDLLIAVGAAGGVVHSISYGFVSAVLTNTQLVDRTGRMFYAGLTADADKGTFLLNLSGEMIGWAIPADEDTGRSAGLTPVIGISDYKKILENLSNGLAAPCLGIEWQAVTDAMKKNGMPAGIYVFSALADRPCYEAGIQSGDIITAINDHETLSGTDFRSVMDSLNCGQLIHLTVERDGIGGFSELEFSVTVGAR